MKSLLRFPFSLWRSSSLRAKLLIPIAGLMLFSLLGSAIAFVTGTALTQNQLLKQQITAESERFIGALNVHVQNINDAAQLLANDPHIIDAIEERNGAVDQQILNDRAVVLRERFDVDLIQIYNRDDMPRVNIVISALYRETALLEHAQEKQPVVCVVEGRALVLSRATIPGGGTVIAGIDLETELDRIVARYRFPTDLGMRVPNQSPGAESLHISTDGDFPFDIQPGNTNGLYSQHFDVPIGDTVADLIMMRSTTDVQQVMYTGLTVMSVSSVVTTVLLVGLSILVTGAIARPIQQISSVVGRVATGDLGQRLRMDTLRSPLGIGQHDEIGALATSFNSMVTELQELYDHLEAKVAARTHELATAADVARAVSTSLDADTVLNISAQLIRNRLPSYHVAIFLIDAETKTAVLQGTDGQTDNIDGKPQLEDPILLNASTLVGRAAALCQPCVVQDVTGDTQYPGATWPAETRAAAAVPMMIGREVMGVLAIYSPDMAAFTLEAIKLLNTLADQIAVGVHNAKLYKSEQKRRRDAEVLEMTGRMLSTSLDLGEVPDRILAMLNVMIPYEHGSLWMQQGTTLEPLAHYGYPEGYHFDRTMLPIDVAGAYAQLVEKHEPIIADDVSLSEKMRDAVSLNRAWLGVPVVTKGTVIGMVSLTRREAGAFTGDDAKWVQAFALQAGVALENAQLYNEIASFNEQLELMVAERTEELNQAYNRLEMLDQRKSEFISVAAHELRTPLTLVNAYGQILKGSIKTEENALLERAITGILTGSARLHEIVNSMLDVARIDSQMLRVIRDDVCLQKIFNHIVGNFEMVLKQRRLTVVFQGLEKLSTIQADGELLHKAFYNLIVNAIKYTPDGGKITVDAFLAPDESGDYVEVVIQDTGIGIDPQHHELIFEKFYQIGEVAFHSSSKTKFKGGGPGLGLAIVRGIVDAHNGEVWVESAGHDEVACLGSEFHVRLPIVEKQAQKVCSEREIVNVS